MGWLRQSAISAATPLSCGRWSQVGCWRRLPTGGRSGLLIARALAHGVGPPALDAEASISVAASSRRPRRTLIWSRSLTARSKSIAAAAAFMRKRRCSSSAFTRRQGGVALYAFPPLIAQPGRSRRDVTTTSDPLVERPLEAHRLDDVDAPGLVAAPADDQPLCATKRLGGGDRVGLIAKQRGHLEFAAGDGVIDTAAEEEFQ